MTQVHDLAKPLGIFRSGSVVILCFLFEKKIFMTLCGTYNLPKFQSSVLKNLTLAPVLSSIHGCMKLH